MVLRVDSGVERRVREGALGCSNCRDNFPIHEGFVDLRAPPRGERGRGLAGEPGAVDEEAEEAERVVALLGIPRGPGVVTVVGGPARHAAAVAARVDDLMVVAIDPDLVRWDEAPGVSRMIAAPGLPFFSRMLRGAVVDGRLGGAWIEEAARVVAPMSRVVVQDAPVEASRTLAEAGLRVLAEEAETVVAARS